MKEALNTGAGHRGPAYNNQGGRRNDVVATNVMPGNGGQASGGASMQQGGVSAQQGRGNRQHSVQQLMVDYSVCQSAVKFAPGYKRLVRDINAPPYQGRVAPGEIPPGYHYV